MVKNLQEMQITAPFLGGKIPWKRKWQPTSVFLPWKPHGQRNQAGYSPRGCKRIGHNWATEQPYENVSGPTALDSLYFYHHIIYLLTGTLRLRLFRPWNTFRTMPCTQHTLSKNNFVTVSIFIWHMVEYKKWISGQIEEDFKMYSILKVKCVLFFWLVSLQS